MSRGRKTVIVVTLKTISDDFQFLLFGSSGMLWHGKTILSIHIIVMGTTKKPSYFPLYWLVNRDPYGGLLQSLYDWVI